MRSHEIEFRALRAIEGLQKNIPPPEAAVAVFQKWPKPGPAAARRLAAHANTARGRDLLWVIGVAANGKLVGADLKAFPDWWAQMLPYFESLAPEVTPLNVPSGERKVVALHIQTERAPFLFSKDPARGISAEVPWLEAGMVRSARRSELIALLSPLQDLPNFEILDAELSAWQPHHSPYGPKVAFRWTLDATVYVVPKGESRVVVPFHRCRSAIGFSGTSFKSDGTELTLTPDKASTAVRATESALLIEGLGRFFLFCCGQATEPDLPLDRAAILQFDFFPTGAERSTTVQAECLPSHTKESNQLARWKL